MALAVCQRRLGQAAARPLVEREGTYYIASFHALAGNPDQALRHLAEANPSWLDYARWDPDWDDLRDDPRFIALLATRPRPQA